MGALENEEWEVLPLNGKYYGTEVKISQGTTVIVWLAFDKYLPEEASIREHAREWTPEQGYDHVEDRHSYETACLISAAPDLLRVVKKLMTQVEDEELFGEALVAVAKAQGVSVEFA